MSHIKKTPPPLLRLQRIVLTISFLREVTCGCVCVGEQCVRIPEVLQACVHSSDPFTEQPPLRSFGSEVALCRHISLHCHIVKGLLLRTKGGTPGEIH